MAACYGTSTLTDGTNLNELKIGKATAFLPYFPFSRMADFSRAGNQAG